jgi:hypothetical protein
MRIPLVPWLQTHRQLLHMELKELKRYAEALEGALETEKLRLKKDVEDQTTTMTERERSDFYEGIFDDSYRLDETFSNILRYSLFVHT